MTPLVLAAVVALAAAHGQLTAPAPRVDFDGNAVSYLQDEPVFTLGGPRAAGGGQGPYTPQVMRCHDFPTPTALTTVTAGAALDLTWTLQATHPGDCALYVSYDADKAAPENWVKLAYFPGCGNEATGLDPPRENTRTVTLPAELPSCSHCVMRWEWASVQQVVDVEFYVQCFDVTIVGNDQFPPPGPTTAISGIEHLPQTADGYRKAYNGEFGPQYEIGPPVFEYDGAIAPPPGGGAGGDDDDDNNNPGNGGGDDDDDNANGGGGGGGGSGSAGAIAAASIASVLVVSAGVGMYIKRKRDAEAAGDMGYRAAPNV